MTTSNEKIKIKVIAKLIKLGNNPENAEAMVNEHFEYVNAHYTGVAKMADVIGYL